jgi:hypothetical protein
MARSVAIAALLLVACAASSETNDDAGVPPERSVTFAKITLHREFYCEGAAIGDLDGDGNSDVVAGPHWYPGPDFAEQRALWTVQAPANIQSYSDCFFQWTRDLDADADSDVLVVGFPGQAAFWLQNPGSSADAAWLRHPVIDVVDNESPELLDLVGDDEPELLLANGGKLAYAARAGESWTVHPLTEDRGYGAFMHGLGAADVNSDGRMDVLEATAWWEQPKNLDGDPVWPRHEQIFGSGGGQMHGYDVDGDGDTDIVATLSAHGYGLAWYEQRADGSFAEHLIVSGAAPGPDADVILHEPHALALADVDGDGLRDLITGERHWGHVPEGEPDFAADARLYWFRLVRNADGARFEPRLIDDDSGIGTQVTVGDVNADDRIDIVIANKKGAFVFVQN